MTTTDDVQPLHAKDILQDAFDEIYKAINEQCDGVAVPFVQVVYRHDLLRFQVRTPPPVNVLAEGESVADVIDVMVRLYPKKAPDLPSIPLTPRQRLFLASHPREDKEAALQEILDETRTIMQREHDHEIRAHEATRTKLVEERQDWRKERNNLREQMTRINADFDKAVERLRKARADKKRLLAEWQATIDRDSQHLCSVRRKTAMLLHRMLDGDDVTEDARHYVMRLQGMQDMHNEHVHEACYLIDDLATMYDVGDVLSDVAEGVEGLRLHARQMRKLGIAGTPS